MDLGEQPVRWFRGGRLNTCFNALDRHVRDGRGDQYRAPAIDPGAAYWAYTEAVPNPSTKWPPPMVPLV